MHWLNFFGSGRRNPAVAGPVGPWRWLAVGLAASLLLAGRAQGQLLLPWLGATSVWTSSANWGGNATIPLPNATIGADIDTPLVSQPVINVVNVTANVTYVGLSSTANLTIENGGILNDPSGAYIAVNSGSQGTVFVTSGAKWSAGFVLVGFEGTGNLSISSAGNVTDSNGYIGDGDGGIGTVEVDGANSTWKNTDSILVASAVGGTGNLSITNGANVTDQDGYIGSANASTGAVMVDGANSTWKNTDTSQAGNIDLYIGDGGTGQLSITNGAQVSDTGGVQLGVNASVNGTAVVSGTNSTWTNGGNLTVGVQGSGNLSVTAGGQVVSNNTVTLGEFNGTSGTILVDGTNSLLSAKHLFVGDLGSGNLTVSGGGEVESTLNPLFIGLGASGGPANGTILVTGTGSELLAGNQSVTVGYSSPGSLAVANGATLKGGTVYVAETTGSTGAATVTGNGSVAQLGELLVGYNGSGNLTVASGGNVTCGNVTLGAESGAQGTLNVTGSNSVLQASGAVGVLIGSMSVTNNATMTVGSGFDVSAGQSALVDGASQLTAAGTFTLVGNLTVSNGSAVNGALGMTVDAAGAAATVLVTGTNTTFGVGLMTVGEKGNGNVTVANGATLTGGGAGTGNGNGSSSGPFIVGQNAGSSGVVSLNPGTPAGNATWSVGTNMFVGYSGAGQVSLGNQSLLEADNLIVGTTSGSSGILTLTAGSQVSVSGGMEMAEQSGAAAAVTFNGGGVVNVAQGLQFVGLSGSTLTMNVTGTASGTQYGVFNVTGGNCLLGGNFVVTLGGNYVPTLGDTFQFFNVTGGNIQGIFANYNLPTLSGNLGWDVSNLTTNGTISVVAGPGVGTPPTFTLFPMNATVRAGGNVTFSAGATASGLVTYQWEKNSVPISGATNSTLTLTNVSAANAGNYAVVATSAGQSFLSGTAVLTVTAAAAPPKITKQPVAQSVKAGATVTIKVTATGTAPLKYAWQRNSKNLVNGKTISGVATATLKLTKVTSAANGGTYRVIVSNAAGKVTSTAVKLTVKAAAKK